ncbi:helix-turn-helix transcriptional regulator [Paraflavitalea speifideaquila]|uniref:helix-turn-helix transcriptional regulator n=1 Tax=Paraflavitalea speifideaquila TaxID=3076558 RepID=UPI003312FD30
MAAAVGISRKYLIKIERGLAPRVRHTVLIRLSKYYEVSVADIATDKSPQSE